MAATKYLIGRIGDPIFALFIGAGAALTRIQREEREAGRNTEQTIDIVKKRWNLVYGN